MPFYCDTFPIADTLWLSFADLVYGTSGTKVRYPDVGAVKENVLGNFSRRLDARCAFAPGVLLLGSGGTTVGSSRSVAPTMKETGRAGARPSRRRAAECWKTLSDSV